MRSMRILGLAWSLNRRSLGRLSLMSLLIVVGVSVFLVVTELANASSESLSEAVTSELGSKNIYRVEYKTNLVRTPDELRAGTAAALAPMHPARLTFVDVLPAAKPQCPPYGDIGDVNMYVLRDADGRVAHFSGELSTTKAYDLCLAGLVVPRSALRETTPVEKKAFGDGLVVHPAYEAAVSLASATPTRVTAVVALTSDADQGDEITQRLSEHFHDAVLMSGLPLEQHLTVDGSHSSGRVEAASRSVALVYGIIGWGILLIVGLGILVAQLVILRDRAWMLGLARSVGARRSDIAALVVLDVAILVGIGFAAAIALCAVLEPVVDGFGMSAFNRHLVLVRTENIPVLLAAIGLTLTVGAGYPMLKAIRLDPVEILERR